MKTTDLIRLEDEIKQLLIDFESARNDDMYLYYVYCCKKFKEANIPNQNIDCEFITIFEHKYTRTNFKICAYESVSRCRRKIQEECPELASDRVKQARSKEEAEYKEYSRI